MANEVRLIDANALEKRMEKRLNSLREAYGNDNPYADGFEEGCVAVEYAENIDPESLRPKGRWVKDRDGDEYCTNCSRYMPIMEVTGDQSAQNYCPNCGAEMEG